MKIAVYAICKNESKHIHRWYESIKNADEIVVTDTGSTDNSVGILRSLGVTVYERTIKPWRFDEARNISLSYVSDDADVCLSLDIDEVMMPNWKENIIKNWKDGVTEIRYPYTFNWEDEAMTIPRITMYGFKIHARWGYSWKYPIHEVVCADDETASKSIVCEEIQCLHYPDLYKKRDYQVLLDQCCIENPEEERFSHLRARELMMHSRFDEAITEFKRHLQMIEGVNIPQVRAMTYRYIARCTKALSGSRDTVLEYMLKGLAEAPYQRESWIWLAQAWMDMGDYLQAYACCQTGMRITDRKTSIECEEGCWNSIPEQISEIALAKIRGGIWKLHGVA